MYFDVSRFSLDGSSPTGIRSGQDQGAKAPEEFCGGKRVFFTWSWRVPVSCPILSRGGRYSSRVTCMVCTYINNMWTYLPRCGKWLSNDMQLVRVKK